jgi:hypothetical protein
MQVERFRSPSAAGEGLSGERVETSARQSEERRKRCVAVGAVLVAVLYSAFTALYWNRYLAPSAGGTFFYLGEQILQGRLPYRDLFLVVTPLQAFKLAALIRIFGDTLVVARLDGAIERVILALLLYFLLIRFSRAASAVLASLLAAVAMTTDNADAVVNYHIDSVFWATGAALCVSFWIRSRNAGRQNLAAAAAGLFAALCLLTKQTTGAGVIAAVGFAGAAIAWRSRGVSQSVRFLILLFAGWLAPIAAFVVWLRVTGSLAPFLRTVFSAETSKGTPLAVLARPVTQSPHTFEAAVAATLMAALLVRWIPKRDLSESVRPVALTGAACCAVIVLTALPGVVPGLELFVGFFAGLSKNVIERPLLLMAITGSALVFVVYGFQIARRELTEAEQQIWMLSAVSFAVSYMLSLSWATYSPMAAPALALLAALVLDRLQGIGAARFVPVASLALLIVYASAAAKVMQPFSWMYWPEPPVSEASSVSALPKLAGLRISQPTLSFTENIVHLVERNTRPGDSLLVYPYFPIFYVLTGLNPPTYVFNHFIDVCPDAVCRNDAREIKAHPPDAIIYMVENLAVLKQDETYFRSGSLSGSREVAMEIEEIASGYNKLFSERIPNSARVMEVYTRKR